MFIIRWWRFLRGFIVIALQGRGIERLINLAIARGIGFWDLRKQKNEARLSLGLTAFRELRPLVRQTRCRLRIKRKVGLPFIKYRLRRRWGLVAGVAIFVLALYLASSFVWHIRIIGTSRLETEEILALVEQLGVYPGVWKRNLNLSELAEELPRFNSTIAWAGLRLHGVLLEIEIVEHLSGQVFDDRPADLVASRDGLVERIVVVAGRAAVKTGDTVSQGDLLIEGITCLEEGILDPAEQPPPEEVRARGKVEARVWYEAREPLKLKQTSRKLTGRSRSSYYLLLPDRRWRLGGVKKNPYQNARKKSRVIKWGWRNLKIPVEIETITYHEVRVQRRTVSYEKALQLARESATQKIKAQVTGKLDRERLYYEEYTEKGAGWVRAVAETKEEITMVKLRQP